MSADTPAAVRLAFAFTDIEGSTRLLERLGGRYAGVLADHAAILRAAIARRGGREVDTQGDAFFAVFPDAADALRFAVDVQRGLAGHAWPDEVTVRVRIGLHAGEAIPTRTGYVGLDVHAAARVAAAAHGGQVLCSGALAAALPDTRAAAGDHAADGHDPEPDLLPLGSFALKDLRQPMELLQAAIPGLPSDFPPPRTLDAPDEPPTAGEPPYPGLVPFAEADAARFFGRAALVADLAERLGRDGFLAIVGASGSGKSSLLRAGLVPAVRARLAAAGEPAARIALLTPGEHPAAALDAALAALPGPPHLVAVDQLEELATLARDAAERDAFIGRLLGLFDRGSAVAVALRADLYAALAPHARLRDLVAAHQAYPGPLAGEDLRAAIEGPAAAGGWRIAPGLADLVIADLGDEPGALPLLAHALRETWERRRGTTLGLRGYLDAGAVAGAIARTAEALAAGLDDRALAAARAVLLRLVRPGDGSPDTRRRAPVAELLGADPDPALARDVLDRLVAARLVVVDGALAEVAHEALIRAWPRLQGWLDADRDALRLARAVTDAATDRARAGGDSSLLWRGARLEAALALPRAALTPDERAFLDASRAHEAAEAAEREASRVRELEAARRAADAERARADETASANRRLRRRAALLVGLLVVTVGLGVTAALLGRQAEDNATLALARELASASDAALERDPELALALAIAAVERLPTTETDRRLRTAIAASLVRGWYPDQVGSVRAISASADGNRLASLASDGVVRLWDTGTRREISSQRPSHGTPVDVALSPEGTWMAAITDSGELWTWDSDTGEIRSITAHAAPGTDIDVSGDARTIITAGEDGITRIWDAADLALRIELAENPGRPVAAAAVSADGSLAVTAEPAWIGLVWDARTGTVQAELVGHQSGILDVAFSPDGSRIATAGMDETVRVWEATSGAPVLVLRGHAAPVTTVAFSPDGDLLVSAAEDGVAIAWDARTGERRARYRGHGGAVTDALITQGGPEVVTAGKDGSIRTWALDAVPPTQRYTGFPGSVIDVAVSPDGRRVLAVGGDFTARVYEAASGAEQLAFREHQGAVLSAALGPDGTTALTVGSEGVARLWDTRTGAAIAQVGDDVMAAALSPDGRSVVTVGADGSARLHDARTGAPKRDVGSATDVVAAGWAPDGTRIWTAHRDGGVRAFDVTNGALLADLAGDGSPIAADGLAVSPDGRRLATALEDGSIRVRSAADGTVEHSLAGDWATTWRLRFSPDGTRLAAGLDDGTARAWDAATGRQLIVIASDPADVYGVAWTPDGASLVLANRRRSDATLHACSTCGTTDDVLSLARTRVFRPLTPQERAAYLHEAAPEASPPPATPAIPVEAPASFPMASPESPAADDLCTGHTGPCDLSPGTYRPSRLRPRVAFTLDTTATGIAQERAGLLFETSDGEVAVHDGTRTFGYGPDGMVRIEPSAAGLLAYLQRQPLLAVSEVHERTVAGRAALAFTVDARADEPVDLLFADPLPFAAVPGEPTHLVAIDVPDGLLVVTASAAGPDEAPTFHAWFESFLETIELPGPWPAPGPDGPASG